MTGPRRKFAIAALFVVAGVALSGCPRPDENPPVRFTGDRDSAIPTTDPTTTTTTTAAPSTTFFYGPDGAGQ